jgi:uncharacterized phiE125 gp8 family phage protein
MTWLNTSTRPRDILCEDILVTPPSVEPLDLEEVKKQRRFSATSLDTRFDMWVSAARQQFEEETYLQLITATRLFLMDCFPVQDVITFWRAPVQAIVSIAYGETGSPETLMDVADYEVFPTALTAGPYPNPGGVRLVTGASWPTMTDDRPGAVRITYRAGFGDAPGAVPEAIHYALMQYVGDFHQYAENQSEKSASLLPIGAGMVRRAASGMMTPVRRMTRW